MVNGEMCIEEVPCLSLYKNKILQRLGLQLEGLGQVESQLKPNPNMKYINPNITLIKESQYQKILLLHQSPLD